jgi:hypothetical protein
MLVNLVENTIQLTVEGEMAVRAIGQWHIFHRVHQPDSSTTRKHLISDWPRPLPLRSAAVSRSRVALIISKSVTRAILVAAPARWLRAAS